MTLFFLTFYFPPTNRMLLGHCCMYFCLYLFLWNIIIIEKKKKLYFEEPHGAKFLFINFVGSFTIKLFIDNSVVF